MQYSTCIYTHTFFPFDFGMECDPDMFFGFHPHALDQYDTSPIAIY